MTVVAAPPIGIPVSNVRRSKGGGLSLPPPGISTFGMPGPYVYDATSARRVPAVGRAIQLYAGLMKQCPMQVFRGYSQLPTPRICDRPQINRGGPWFVQVSVEDYLLSGNAVSRVIARDSTGWPASVQWLPIQWVYMSYDISSGAESYYYLGSELPIDDVIHVRRGADRWYPMRGVGVVEEYLSTLDRVAMEEEYERSSLSDGAVPSVAVITPQSTLTQDVADTAKADWMAKFDGPGREPVFLPNGTVIQPLAWSPTDTQLAEARRLSLIDVANMFNLDGYWLGAPVAGMTYRTAGPQYQQILRTSLEPVFADFEDEWSFAWLPRGQTVRFQRAQLLREDLATSSTAASTLFGAGIISQEEARVMVGLPPDMVGAIGAGADMAGSDPEPDAIEGPAESEPVDDAGGIAA